MTNIHKQSSDEQFAALDKLAHTALAQWDLDNASIKLIKHRENTVYQVDADQGRFALRIHRYGYHPDSDIQTELDWILALSKAGIPVPQPVISKKGNLFELCQFGDTSEARQIDIFCWAHGAPFGSVEDVLGGKIDRDKVVSCYEKAGALAARMHNHAENYVLPPGGTRQAWDEQGLLGEEPLWGRGWENELLSPDNREKILQVREIVLDKLTAFGKGSDRYGLIHCDFMPENLFIDGEKIEIIDFDDAGFGWHMFDFATALFFYLDTPVFDELLDRMVNGYREHRDLAEDQLAMLPTFLMLRGVIYLGWLHTRKETVEAHELGPIIVPAICDMAENYLANH